MNTRAIDHELLQYGVTINERIRLVDKPVGFSTFQLVRLLQKKHIKVGHTGTLDPFASGLVILMLDKATKDFRQFEQFEKEYTGEIMLGFATNTFDITGQITIQSNNIPNCRRCDLQKTADSFVGQNIQIPPAYSALKIKGQRSYQLSRQGKKVSLPARPVTIKKFLITDIFGKIIRFTAVVGKGVYIRSLAHDFGSRLGCGGTLISLRRIRIGGYRVGDAADLGAFLLDI